MLPTEGDVSRLKVPIPSSASMIGGNWAPQGKTRLHRHLPFAIPLREIDHSAHLLTDAGCVLRRPGVQMQRTG